MEAPIFHNHADAAGHSPADPLIRRVLIFERIGAGLLFIGYGVAWSGFFAADAPFVRRSADITASAHEAWMLIDSTMTFGTPIDSMIESAWLHGLFGMKAALELLMWVLVFQTFLRLCGHQGFLRRPLFWWCAALHAGGYIFVANGIIFTMHEHFLTAGGDSFEVLAPLKITLILAGISVVMLYRTRRAVRLESGL